MRNEPFLRLLGAVALRISAKINERGIPSMASLVPLIGAPFSPSQFAHVESIVLIELQYRMLIVTPYS